MLRVEGRATTGAVGIPWAFSAMAEDANVFNSVEAFLAANPRLSASGPS
jgi:hypothetical protein